MGFIIDGTWAGVDYDEKQMSGKKVAKMFDVEKEVFDAKGRLGVNTQFELHKSKRKVVRGQKRMIKQFSLPSTFTVNKGGDTVTVTYFRKKINKRDKDTGRPYSELTPRKITSDRRIASYDITRHLDRVVYLSLHPQCHTSPFADKIGEKTYGLKNYGNEAKVYMSSKREQSALYNKIFTDPVMVLRLRAKGMGIHGVDNLGDESVRKALSEKLDAAIQGVGGNNYETFVREFNAPYSGIKGQVQECLDKSYFTRKTNAGGLITYYWADSMPMSGEIMKVPRGKDPIHALVDFMVNQWESYSKAIGEAIRYGDQTHSSSVREIEGHLVDDRSAKDKDVKDLTLEEVAQQATKLSVVVYNPVDNGVYMYNAKAKKLEDEAFMVADIGTWQSELQVELSTNAELLKKIKQKLTGKRNGKRLADSKKK